MVGWLWSEWFWGACPGRFWEGGSVPVLGVGILAGEKSGAGRGIEPEEGKVECMMEVHGFGI